MDNVEEYQWFRVDVNPVPWAVGPLSVGKHNGGTFARVGRNEELWNYQQAVKKSLEGKVFSKIDGKFEITFFFWRKLDEYNTSKKKAKNQLADVTNLQKATEDALQGILFDNDQNTVIVTSVLVEQSEHTEGRVIICIESLYDGRLEDLQNIIPDDLTPEQNPNIPLDNSWPSK